ncbi:hypothetical protein RvY_15149 [Ramazzottius varieornatus]|uniref:Uncharacterized protein n=1 Tax=Ramazzottius varieornatus TaxID=947166 RepID=A0A1D1VTX3_RAMVA|nr:hypothetical protein RvY_15149 [Ramazzottius varieornatus]
MFKCGSAISFRPFFTTGATPPPLRYRGLRNTSKAFKFANRLSTNSGQSRVSTRPMISAMEQKALTATDLLKILTIFEKRKLVYSDTLTAFTSPEAIADGGATATTAGYLESSPHSSRCSSIRELRHCGARVFRSSSCLRPLENNRSLRRLIHAYHLRDG